ncbi:hypothetical protein CRI94_07050 [Longibacter salinarum]|uniref:Transporter n=1 Tax=Longibacter salinarum TaxID=1850348 RepID=A0A2A8CYP8_9BACT|nr:efflux transporter outer membrane subunit [Longibacter salinarum]PEN13815.1 hypothetical protein CRI94_07050 [Longibacter salinarum]
MPDSTSAASFGSTAVVVCVLVASVISACSPERSVPEPVEAPASFSQQGSADQIDRWWTAFGDDSLNAAIDTALSANFTLRAAWARLQEARAIVDQEQAGLFPQIDASASAVTERRSEDGAGRNPSERDLELGAAASYEIDLWGRIRARANAEQARAEATLSDYRAASLSIAAEVTRAWMQLAEARRQLDLTEQQVQTNQQVLSLLRERFGTGQIRSVDILRQRQLIAASEQDRSAARARVGVLEHQLAVLLGTSPPRQPVAGPDSLPDLPPAPETGVPAELIRRRPDVRAARFRVAAADRDLAAAMSDRYPRLTLTASAATSAQAAENLFDDWVARVAGDLLAPIFYGGALQAEVDRAEARKRELVYAYGQTVLQAFRDVEDALVLETSQRKQVEKLIQQEELAQQAYEQLRVQYLNGSGSYLDVLTALRDVQRLQRDLLAARRILAEDRIALYRALAGAFTTERERDDT